ncbi:hypothetical protein WME98_16830 [Sorangium sp. So ce296]
MNNLPQGGLLGQPMSLLIEQPSRPQGRNRGNSENEEEVSAGQAERAR